MINIDTMQDASEIVHYDNTGIPLYIREGLLSNYPDYRALCHWHEDIELIYIFSGEMQYYINGKSILLLPGDSLVINSRQMHYGYSNHHRECSFLCILFHPALLASNKHLAETYLAPILENSSIEYLQYSSSHPYRANVAALLEELYTLKKDSPVCYEFEVLSCLIQLWRLVYLTCQQESMLSNVLEKSTDLLAQKKMVSYIYQKYSETISLEEIAASGNVSRSKCCILFKKNLQQSPIDFLNAYRLEVSCNLLVNTSESISNIATSCGFNHLSYFSKLFARKYGCTPSKYRR